MQSTCIQETGLLGIIGVTIIIYTGVQIVLYFIMNINWGGGALLLHATGGGDSETRPRPSLQRQSHWLFSASPPGFLVLSNVADSTAARHCSSRSTEGDNQLTTLCEGTPVAHFDLFIDLSIWTNQLRGGVGRALEARRHPSRGVHRARRRPYGERLQRLRALDAVIRARPHFRMLLSA